MMRVSKEFFMYKSGVYKCSDLYDASKPAYHTVRIVGWGENNDYGRQIKYWVKNKYSNDGGTSINRILRENNNLKN